MNLVSQARWVQLAESRHLARQIDFIDLTAEPEASAVPERAHRSREEYEHIRTELERLTAQLSSPSN